MKINTNTWNRIRYTIYRPIYSVITSVFKPFRKQSIEGLDLQKGEKVLLLGAGTGLDLEFFSSGVQIYAIDITPAMIRELKSRADDLEIEVYAEVMDGSDLDFETETFDAVVLHLIVAVIPDPIGCLQETERVLKPGGRFTIFDKFVESGEKPSVFRRMINPLSNLLATNLNRDIDALLSHTGLTKTGDEKLRSIFRLVKGQKSDT